MSGWSAGFERLGGESSPDTLRRLGKLIREVLNRVAGRGPVKDDGPPVARVVEVGAWSGLATRVICRPGVSVHAIDTWKGCPGTPEGIRAARIGQAAAFRTFCRNVAPRLCVDVHPHVGPSDLFAAVWPWAPDAVWIDADQEHTAARRLIQEWMRLVPGGRLIAGGGHRRPAVAMAVAELLPGRASDGDVWWCWKA